MAMMRNYRIAEHPYWHAARCAGETAREFAGTAWREFVKPVTVVATGIVVGMPLARMIGEVLASAWR